MTGRYYKRQLYTYTLRAPSAARLSPPLAFPATRASDAEGTNMHRAASKYPGQHSSYKRAVYSQRQNDGDTAEACATTFSGEAGENQNEENILGRRRRVSGGTGRDARAEEGYYCGWRWSEDTRW